MRRITSLLAILLLAPPAAAQNRAECRHEAERSARVRADASDRLTLIARAGSLRVEGRAGASEIVVRGRACASSPELLEALRLETTRGNGHVRVEVAEIDQQWRGNWNRYARLDLVVEVPAGMAADIDDGSGELFAKRTGALTIDDGSGEIEIEDVTGDVRIDDGSGEIRVTRVRGDVTIDDGSGEIEIRDVTGSVEVDDGSGSIRIERITGSVRIPDGGSGSIDVSDVGGDLIVRDKGNGDVRYRDVRGRVDIPERGRKRRR